MKKPAAFTVLFLAGCGGAEERDPYTLARPFEPIAVCPATGDPCAAAASDAGLYAGYRKDYFLPLEQYPTELTDLPLDGGRFHVAAISLVSGTVTDVFIDSENVRDLLVEPRMEWYHVWPERAEAGRPLWFAFHSRDPAWDGAATGRIRIETDSGTAVDGAFPVQSSPLVVSYLTTDSGRQEVFIHVKNTSAAPLPVTRVLFDGRDVLAGGALCVPKTTLDAGEAALWRLPLCSPPQPGQAWTLVVESEGAPAAVAVGRHLRPFYPIEAWPKRGDCPLPSANDEAFELFTKAGLDTFYIYWNGGESCGYDNAEMFEQILPARGDVHVLLGDDFPFLDPPAGALADTRAVAGFLTGDESDWEIYDQGVPRASIKAERTRSIWRHYPELLTYNGAMTDKHIGVFAGMTDVQGIDVYAAGCAPHTFVFGNFPPLKAPYDFLNNARLNHMPWPTWLYAQGLGDWSPGPAAHEIVVQGMEVMAAGGKGLMWFQTGVDLAKEHPEEWRAIADVSWLHQAVRRFLREGDPTGLASSDPDTVVEAIRAPEALVVPVVSIKADEAVTDQACLEFQLGTTTEEPHWRIEDRLVEVQIRVPDDLAVLELFEVLPRQVAPVTTKVTYEDRTLILSDIPVSNAQPAHLYVLGAHSGVREEVSAELAARQ